jgi:hypothetical protein
MLIHVNRQLFTPFGATALQNFTAAFGLHTLTKAVNPLPTTDFWLISTLWHSRSPKKTRALSPELDIKSVLCNRQSVFKVKLR